MNAQVQTVQSRKQHVEKGKDKIEEISMSCNIGLWIPSGNHCRTIDKQPNNNR